MSILVTGGTGFVGSFCVRKLLSEGEQVVVYDISGRSDLLRGIEKQVRVVRGDILDLPAILRAVKAYSVDKIIHIGAMTKVDSDENPFLSFKVNGEGTLNLLEVSRILGISKFVLMSSLDVYEERLPENGEAITEEHKLNPVGMIGVTKLAGENCGSYYSRTYGLDFVALRFTAIFGPGKTLISRHTELTVEGAVENAIQGRRVEISSPAKDLLYILDAANALYLAESKKNLPSRVYNIGSGRLTSSDEIASAIRSVFPNVEVHSTANQQKTMVLNVNKAAKELGFTQKYDLENAIRDYVDFRKKYA